MGHLEGLPEPFQILNQQFSIGLIWSLATNPKLPLSNLKTVDYYRVYQKSVPSLVKLTRKGHCFWYTL